MTDPIIIKFKILWSDAKIPVRLPGDAGWDLSMHHELRDKHSRALMAGTGIAVEIPPGYFGLVRPRSSIAGTGYQFCSSGVIDSSYRGEIIVPLKEDNRYDEDGTRLYRPGDRIAQLIILPLPDVTFVQVNKLSETQRGKGGFGSTGR